MRAYLNGGTKIHESPIEEVKHMYPKLTDANLGKKLLGEKGLLEGKPDGGTEQMKRVLAGVEYLALKDDQYKKYSTEIFGDRAVRQKMSDDHDSTTQYFTEINKKFSLHDLLKAHFSKAPLARSNAQGTKKNRKFVSDNSVPAYSIMEMYFSYIPDYIKFMTGKFRGTTQEGLIYGDLIVEAWLTLMWRGYLFYFLHQFKTEFEGIYVPSEYCGSRLPVYLI